MSRRKAGLLAILASVLVVVVAACGSDPTATPSPTPIPDKYGPAQAEWNALKAAAAEEGELIAFLCCALGSRLDPFMDEAEAALGIDIVSSTGSSRQQWEKVQAEREAGVYSLDVWTGGLRTSNTRLLPGGALANLKSLLFLPEVLDESLWYGGHFWGDNAPEMDQTKVFAYGGSASLAEIAYNTDNVDPSELTSYEDLLSDRFHGKIIARDPREAGSSQSVALFYLLMGEQFLRDLLTTQDITFTSDARQAAEQLALGAYDLCLFACTQEVQAAREDGLPVSEEWPNAIEEGSRISTGGNTLMAVDNPPHPNAQKLFVNWLLSKDGQTWYQKVTEEQSLRNDIPTDMVVPTSVRQEGADYLLFERDPSFQASLEEAVNVAIDALR